MKKKIEGIFEGWLKDLVSEGLISFEQKEKILEFYQKREELRKKELHKHLVKWLIALGCFLLGLSIVSFIAAHWQKLTPIAKLGIIIFFLIISYVWGWWLREYKGMVKSGNSLISLGTVIYGAGIFLIGQTYHTPAYNWPSGFILWFIGVITVAHIIEIIPLFVFAFVLGVIPLFGYIFLILNWRFSVSMFLIPFWLIVISIILSFYIGYSLALKKNFK